MFKGVFTLIFPWLTPHISTFSALSNNSKNDENTALHAESILLEEFNYVSVTLYQLKEERSRLFNLYLLIVGILASGLGTIAALYPTQVITVTNQYGYNPQNIHIKDSLVLACVVLIGMSFLSFGFFVRLLSLNKNCRGCLIALNKIKETYIDLMPQIEKAFYWRLSNIPHVARVGSSVFLTGLTVAAIGSLCVSGAVLVTLNMLLVLSEPWSYRVCITSGLCGPVIPWILAVFAFVVVNLLFFWYYLHWKKHIVCP